MDAPIVRGDGRNSTGQGVWPEGPAGNGESPPPTASPPCAAAPGSSIWYARLALDRLMWERLQLLVDPDAEGVFRHMEERARRETGQNFWWRPGQLRPN